MSLVLHIVRKDVRHLYLELLITLGVIVAFAWAEPSQWMTGHTTLSIGLSSAKEWVGPLGYVLLPLMWLVMITRLVQDESLVGDKQFWITRPYRWPELLAAKLLFVVVFLFLPFLLVQAYLLHHAGFDLRTAQRDLLLNNLYIAALFFLPFLVLAAISSSFAKVVLWIVGALLCVIFLFPLLASQQMVPYYVQPICVGIAVCAALAVLLLQYARRRTLVSRMVLIGLPFALTAVQLLGSARAFVYRGYPLLPETTMSRLTLGPSPIFQQPGAGRVVRSGANVVLTLPVGPLTALSGMKFLGDGLSMSVATADGFRWSSGFVQQGSQLSFYEPSTNQLWMPAWVFERISNTAADLHLEFAGELERIGAPTSVLAAYPYFRAGGGICNLEEDGQPPACRFPLRFPPAIDVSAITSTKPCSPGDALPLDSVNAPREPASAGVGPVASPTRTVEEGTNLAPLHFDPVVTANTTTGQGPRQYLCPGTPIDFYPHQFAGHGRVSMDVHGVVLGPYAMREH
ncbi:MAG TPA: hypothetical protein VGD59_04435 [Acidisarcina sp.]